MKKLVILILSYMLISGCTPGNNVPGSTLAGATAGGLAGGLLFHGSPAGIVGGALLGGIVGDAIGNQMDARDHAMMGNAIVSAPIRKTTQWTNDRTGTTYRVTPTRDYYSNDCYCREYTSKINVNGQWQTAYGRACKMPDGSWKIVS